MENKVSLGTNDKNTSETSQSISTFTIIHRSLVSFLSERRHPKESVTTHLTTSVKRTMSIYVTDLCSSSIVGTPIRTFYLEDLDYLCIKGATKWSHLPVYHKVVDWIITQDLKWERGISWVGQRIRMRCYVRVEFVCQRRNPQPPTLNNVLLYHIRK